MGLSGRSQQQGVEMLVFRHSHLCWPSGGRVLRRSCFFLGPRTPLPTDGGCGMVGFSPALRFQKSLSRKACIGRPPVDSQEERWQESGSGDPKMTKKRKTTTRLGAQSYSLSGPEHLVILPACNPWGGRLFRKRSLQHYIMFYMS